MNNNNKKKYFSVAETISSNEVHVIKSYLEVNNNSKDKDSSHKVHQIRKVLSVESFSQTSDFVGSCGQKMEQCNDGTFKLST